MSGLLLENESTGLAEDLSAEVRSAAARLAELGPRLDQLGEARRVFLADAEAAVRTAVAQAPRCERLWGLVLDRLRAGLPGEPARAAVGTAVAALDRWTELTAAAAAFQAQAAEHGLTVPGAGELDQARRTLARLKTAADRALAFLLTPMPPVDWERFERAAAEVAAGRFRTPDQIRAELDRLPDGEGD